MERVILRTVGVITHTYILYEYVCPKCNKRGKRRIRDDERMPVYSKCQGCLSVLLNDSE